MERISTGFVGFDRQPYRRSIDIAGEMGFDHLEMYMDGDSRRQVLVEDQEIVRDKLDAAGVDPMVHLPFPIMIASPHPHVREGSIREMKACIEAATAIGATKGVLHPDSKGWVRVWGEEKLTNVLVESLQELHEFATQRDFEICLENVFDTYISIYDYPDLFERVDVSMTLDTGHAAISGMDSSDMGAFVEEHLDTVSHIHLNDIRHLDVGYRRMDEHLPVGYGTLDFAEILRPVLESDWNGTISIELDTPAFEYLEPSKQHLDNVIQRETTTIPSSQD